MMEGPEIAGPVAGSPPPQAKRRSSSDFVLINGPGDGAPSSHPASAPPPARSKSAPRPTPRPVSSSGLHSNNEGCTDFLLITPNAIDSSVPLSAKDAEWLVELAGNSPESPTSSMANDDAMSRVQRMEQLPTSLSDAPSRMKKECSRQEEVAATAYAAKHDELPSRLPPQANLEKFLSGFGLNGAEAERLAYEPL